MFPGPNGETAPMIRSIEDRYYPAEQTICAHCHRRIRYVTGLLGGAWQHIWSMSVYCTLSGEERAAPLA